MLLAIEKTRRYNEKYKPMDLDRKTDINQLLQKAKYDSRAHQNLSVQTDYTVRHPSELRMSRNSKIYNIHMTK